MAFGRRVPLAQLLAHPTIERLAVVLRDAAKADDWRPLVEIRRGPTGRPPLFLLPGAGGNVLYFHPLAQHLAAGRPIHGLQAVGLDGRTPPLTTVEAVAAANIDDMRRVWPAGPYYLAGHSFGGHVALEMAQQLQRQGLAVGLLAVLDTAAPDFDPIAAGAGWRDADWLAQIAQEIEAFFGIRLGISLDDLRPLTLDEQLALVIARMQQAGAWAPGADPDQLRGYLQVYQANSQAAPVRYDAVGRVPVALFKASEADAGTMAQPAGLTALRTRRDWGWGRYARGAVEVFDVPGTHLSMLTPRHAPTLARLLDAALASADAAAAPMHRKAVP
jgi:thioesterase domain-containing protein